MPLALDWLSFKAYPVDKIVQLDWQTANEIDTDYFEVEHSADGVHFKSFTSVDAKGASASIHNYQTRHLEPIIGTNYYRLKQIDLTGKFDYSPVQIVNFEQVATWVGEVYPNPTTNWANIIINTPVTEVVNIQIFDVTGKLIQNEKQNTLAGSNALYFDFSNWTQGSYWIKMTIGQEVFSRKVVVTQ